MRDLRQCEPVTLDSDVPGGGYVRIVFRQCAVENDGIRGKRCRIPDVKVLHAFPETEINVYMHPLSQFTGFQTRHDAAVFLSSK